MIDDDLLREALVDHARETYELVYTKDATLTVSERLTDLLTKVRMRSFSDGAHWAEKQSAQSQANKQLSDTAEILVATLNPHTPCMYVFTGMDGQKFTCGIHRMYHYTAHHSFTPND